MVWFAWIYGLGPTTAAERRDASAGSLFSLDAAHVGGDGVGRVRVTDSEKGDGEGGVVEDDGHVAHLLSADLEELRREVLSLMWARCAWALGVVSVGSRAGFSRAMRRGRKR